MVEQLLASKIRALRKQRGLTLEDLARAANLSKGLLSKVENNKVSPTIATLIKISQGLQVPVSSFFDEIDQGSTPLSLVRARQREGQDKVATSGPYSYQSLTSLRGRKILEPFFVTYFPDSRYRRHRENHKGEEFMFVLQGRLEFSYGDEKTVLEPGDSVHFDSKVLHTATALDGVPAECLGIVGYFT